MAHTYPQGNPPPYPGQPHPNYGPPPVVQQPVTVVYPANSAFVQVGTAIPPVLVSSQMGTIPCHFVCKSCNHHVLTRVEMKPTTRTHLFALLLCVLGFWPCVCLPYCMDSCNNADHYCPNCGSYIGSYLG